MILEYIKPFFQEALLKIGSDNIEDIHFEYPKSSEHGDISTNMAMRLAKQLKKSPKMIAEEIISNLDLNPNYLKSISIAGAGFINIKFNDSLYKDLFVKLIEKENNLGKLTVGNGKSVNVEYVSVNPTGLLHIGHGRNASVGDTIANLFEWLGYNVTREYYFNNAGNQMNNLAKSIHARYNQQLGDSDYPFPENGYHGEYIIDIANQLIQESVDKYKEDSTENIDFCRKYGEQWCFEKIKHTLSRMKIEQDVFYNEDSLYSDGKINEVLEEFKSKGLSYEKDGATWLAFSKLGLEDDRVIIKSSGEPTYRLPDIAYHCEKFKRGFDIIIDIFGSDHIATVPDVLAGVKALGYDSDKIKVFIHQFVTLWENGEQVKMSKRTGKAITLDDLIDELGPDVVRFFLIMRGVSTHIEFDLDLAREQSEKNPLFYLQYAHARICSVFDKVKEFIETNSDINFEDLNNNIDLDLLKEESEILLIKKLLQFEENVLEAGQKSEPHLLIEYLRELAASFHIFYYNCRIIGDDINMMNVRLKLAEITRIALNNGLTIFVVSPPERI